MWNLNNFLVFGLFGISIIQQMNIVTSVKDYQPNKKISTIYDNNNNNNNEGGGDANREDTVIVSTVDMNVRFVTPNNKTFSFNNDTSTTDDVANTKTGGDVVASNKNTKKQLCDVLKADVEDQINVLDSVSIINNVTALSNNTTSTTITNTTINTTTTNTGENDENSKDFVSVIYQQHSTTNTIATTRVIPTTMLTNATVENVLPFKQLDINLKINYNNKKIANSTITAKGLLDNSSIESTSNDDEPTDLMQNDQPEKQLKFSLSNYGSVRKQSQFNQPQQSQQLQYDSQIQSLPVSLHYSQQQNNNHHSHHHNNNNNNNNNHHNHQYNKQLPPLPMSTMNRKDLNIDYTKEVIIKQGHLKGMIRIMHINSGLKNVKQFLGIPYAAAPIDNGRFMPPGAPPPWHGMKYFTAHSPVCPQKLPNITGVNLSAGRYDQLKRLLTYLKNENEDCLFLNLYVPQTDIHSSGPINYPVIVFVHGESYEWNSGNPYDGSVLSSYGQVIVVTLNYRLGVLGFLKPGSNEHTVSNFGLLDQIAALQWVKDNIGAFGGNNKAVTLMGHGTGAACVNLLMVSTTAKGLFHRAILMSGSALSDWAIANHPLQATAEVMEEINCKLRDNHEEMLECLRKKRYQEILKAETTTSEYSTVFGPAVDNLVVPNELENIMKEHNGISSRYDLLFGMTEIESYHSLNAVELHHGLLERERDNILRFYMQNRFELRPDIAYTMTLQEYTEHYANPKVPLAREHRDTILEILSDARIAAPLIQMGLYHSKVNPRCFMYVFAHNSIAGEFSKMPLSISGEDLPYVFGAPLASTSPFHTKYSPEERLLSEAIMVSWTNFAKTGNPNAPHRDQYLNLEPKDWERYNNLVWPEFDNENLQYMNIGIPPVINKKYKEKYMNFWNEALPNELNRTIYSKPYKELFAPPLPIGIFGYNNGGDNGGGVGSNSHNNRVASAIPNGSGSRSSAHLNYYPDKSTEDPIRELKHLLNQPHLSKHNVNNNNNNNKPDMYNTQSLVVTPNPADLSLVVADYGSQSSSNSIGSSGSSSSAMGENHNNNNNIIVKADTTLNILIAIVILFLLLNVVIILIYLVRRNYLNKTLKRKLDVLTLDGATTDDDIKRSKFNDGDESFILDIVRKTTNDYHTNSGGGGGGGGNNRRNNRSPISGYLLSRQLSTSTVDAHTKVCDWMSQEIAKQSIKHTKKSPNFSLKNHSFFRRQPAQQSATDKVSVAIDATPNARSASILQQTPVEYLKSNSIEYDNGSSAKETIICQEINITDSSLIDSVDLRDSKEFAEQSPEKLTNGRRNSFTISTASFITKGSADLIKIDHRHSRSDPVQMYYPTNGDNNNNNNNHNNKITTVFIEDTTDVNVTSRIEPIVDRAPLSPEEQLKTIQMRNYPKVLPNYPENENEYVLSSTKRRSLPPQYFSMNPVLRTPPTPPPRTTSTLGRRPSVRRESRTLLTTSPIQVAEEPPIDEEPVITCNVLHVGPLIPKQSLENIYSNVNKKIGPLPQNEQLLLSRNSTEYSSAAGSSGSYNSDNSINLSKDEESYQKTNIKPPSGYQHRCNENETTKHQPQNTKIIIKPNIIRRNSTDRKSNGQSITRVQVPQDVTELKITSSDSTNRQIGILKIPTTIRTNGSSSSSNNRGESGSLPGGSSSGSNTNDAQDETGEKLIRDERSPSDSSTSSSAETVKQLF